MQIQKPPAVSSWADAVARERAAYVAIAYGNPHHAASAQFEDAVRLFPPADFVAAPAVAEVSRPWAAVAVALAVLMLVALFRVG